MPLSDDDIQNLLSGNSSQAPSSSLLASLDPSLASYLQNKMAAPAGATSSDPDSGDEDDSSPEVASEESEGESKLSDDQVATSQASPAPASGPSPINPELAQYLMAKSNMPEAQAAAAKNQLYAGLARAGGTLAHALSMSTQPLDQSGFNALDQSAQAPVQAVQAQQASALKDLQAQQTLTQNQQSQLALKQSQAQQDPNSAESVAFRKSVERLAPGIAKQYGDIWNQVTAADQDKILKPIELKEQIDARKQTASLAHDYKNQQQQNSAMQNTMGILESTRGSPAVAQAEKDIYAAQKAKTLMNLYGDPNKLSPEMAKLVVSEIGKIASGGQASEAELNAITPSTLHGALAKTWEKLSGDPTPAGVGAFLKQYQDYAHQLTQDAQSVIQDRYGRVIEARSSQLGPANTRALQDQYLNRFNQDAPIRVAQNAPDRTPQTMKRQVSQAEVQAYAQKYKMNADRAAAYLRSHGYAVN